MNVIMSIFYTTQLHSYLLHAWSNMYIYDKIDEYIDDLIL